MSARADDALDLLADSRRERQDGTHSYDERTDAVLDGFGGEQAS